MAQVFISYSHKDEKWKDRLEKHLKVLEGENLFSFWNDRHIEPGDDWFEKILILSPCAWQEISWLTRLQIFPQDGIPLASFSDYEQEEKLVAITRKVKEFVQNIKTEKDHTQKAEDFKIQINNLPTTNISPFRQRRRIKTFNGISIFSFP